MATWEEFYQKAKKNNLLNSFSEMDLALAKRDPKAGMELLGYKIDYENAATPALRAAAHLAAENLREKNGYTGGADGATTSTTESFTLSTAPQKTDASVFGFADVVNRAKEGNVYDRMSEADIRLAKENPDAGMSIVEGKIAYGKADTDEARARINQNVNRIRSDAGGYTAGTDGMAYQRDYYKPSDFTASKAPTYENRYDTQIQALLDAYLSKKPFSYRTDTDPLYAAYKKEYTREGQRASADALGRAASLTGGVPSSYAVTAAAQAGDFYAAGLADKVPALYEKAYQRYLQDMQQKERALTAMLKLEQADYNKFGDSLTQYNADRQFSYGQFTDTIDLEEKRRKQETEDAYRAAKAGDYSLLDAMGISTDSLKKSDAYSAAYQRYLDTGDYAPLEAIGVLTDSLREKDAYEKAYTLFEKTGDTRALEALGVDLDWEYQKRRRENAAFGAKYGDYGPLGEAGYDPTFMLWQQQQANTEDSEKKDKETRETDLALARLAIQMKDYQTAGAIIAKYLG